MKKEIRSFEIELRKTEESEKRIIEGYAAVFNSLSGDLGGFREQIAPGAFRNALKNSDVRALYNHDSNQLPLGRSVSKTLRLAEDDKGLKVEIDLPNTQLGNDIAESIKRGDISQMSFGFIVEKDGDTWEEKEGGAIRTLTNVRELFDVSPVVYPAYKDTEVALRSLAEWRDGNTKDIETDAKEEDPTKEIVTDLSERMKKLEQKIRQTQITIKKLEAEK